MDELDFDIDSELDELAGQIKPDTDLIKKNRTDNSCSSCVPRYYMYRQKYTQQNCQHMLEGQKNAQKGTMIIGICRTL